MGPQLRPIPLRLQPLFQPEDLPTVPPTAPPTVPPDVPWKKMNLPKLQLTQPKLQWTPPKLQLTPPKLQWLTQPKLQLTLPKLQLSQPKRQWNLLKSQQRSKNLRCHHKPDSNPTHQQLSLMILPEQMMIKEGVSWFPCNLHCIHGL